MSSQANFQILNNLSNKYDGKSFNFNQFQNLKNELSLIEAQSLTYTNETNNDLINSKWIFIILFVFLSFEWFLRNRINII